MTNSSVISNVRKMKSKSTSIQFWDLKTTFDFLTLQYSAYQGETCIYLTFALARFTRSQLNCEICFRCWTRSSACRRTYSCMLPQCPWRSGTIALRISAIWRTISQSWFFRLRAPRCSTIWGRRSNGDGKSGPGKCKSDEPDTRWPNGCARIWRRSTSILTGGWSTERSRPNEQKW